MNKLIFCVDTDSTLRLKEVRDTVNVEKEVVINDKTLLFGHTDKSPSDIEVSAKGVLLLYLSTDEKYRTETLERFNLRNNKGYVWDTYVGDSFTTGRESYIFKIAEYVQKTKYVVSKFRVFTTLQDIVESFIFPIIDENNDEQLDNILSLVFEED